MVDGAAVLRVALGVRRENNSQRSLNKLPNTSAGVPRKRDKKPLFRVHYEKWKGITDENAHNEQKNNVYSQNE